MPNALAIGYTLKYALTIEGIPYVFVEDDAVTAADGSAVGVPSGYLGTVPALTITDERISNEIDRKEGVGRGGALDVLLSYDGMDDASVLASLFGRPSATALVTNDVGGSDILILADDTSAFPSSGAFYIGREYVTYTGKTATSFSGCTRGVAGYPYEYRTTEIDDYRRMTDVPQQWRGRFVSLWGHYAAPDGRLLESTWAPSSPTASVLIWRGFIDEPPQPAAHGMALRCLPLERLGSRDLGSEFAGEIVPIRGEDEYVVYATTEGTVKITVTYSGTTSGTKTVTLSPTSSDGVVALGTWTGSLAYAAVTALAAEAWLGAVGIGLTPSGESVSISCQPASGYTLDDVKVYFPNRAALYFLRYDQQSPVFSFDGLVGPVFPVTGRFTAGAWLPVKQTEGEGLADLSIPSSGIGVVEPKDGKPEIIRWDSSSGSAVNGVVMVRVSERTIGESGDAERDLSLGGTFKVASGVYDTVGQALLTLLESSGTGLRGTFDTLGLGQGLGVPEDWIDTASMQYLESPIPAQDIPLLAEGTASLAELVGGWLAIAGKCLVQRIPQTGFESELAVVDVNPYANPDALTLTSTDVTMDGVAPLKLAEPPNIIKAKTKGVVDDGFEFSVLSRSQIQREGAREWSLNVPGAKRVTIAQAATRLFALGMGQMAAEIPVPVWVSPALGDMVVLNLSHPAIYDWENGSRAPASVSARVVGIEASLSTGEKRLKVLMGGLAPAGVLLPPSATVQAVPSTTEVTVLTNEGEWFRDGDVVTLYNIGLEGTEQTTATIATAASDGLTFSAALPAWVAAGTIVTWPPYSSATARQADSFMFYRADKEWR